MSENTYKIILIATIIIFFISAISLLFFSPTPSDEEIPRGSRRVIHTDYIF